MGQIGLERGSAMWKHLINKKDERFLSYIHTFVLPECQKGNIRFFDDAQRVFTFLPDRQLQIDIAAANEKLLQDISIKRLLWLSENFRSCHDDYYAYVYGNIWNANRNINVSRIHLKHLTDGQYDATMKLGTFSSNGYYRQECMERLRDMEGSLPFLILRMNDWVTQIREKAYELSQKRLKKCGLYELFQAFPSLEKVKNARRRDGAYICSLESQAGMLIKQKFQTQQDEAIARIPRYEIQIKNAIYRFINSNQVLKREQMERLLQSERTGYGQTLLILGIFRHYGYDPSRAKIYLHSRSAFVRYHTLVCRYEQEHAAWDGLDAMLLDPSRRIRDYAAYILDKCTDMDIIAFYRKELDRNVSRIVLCCIGEHGTKADLEVIKPYLEDGCESICKAALAAYGKLAQTDGEEIYWKFLFHPRQVLARQAYRCIRKYGISYGAPRLYEAYLQNRSGFLADYLLELLLGEPFWARLPYLLMLNCDRELTENHRQAIVSGMIPFYMYGSVTKQQAETIRSLLAQNGERIPAPTCKRILFDLEHITKE